MSSDSAREQARQMFEEVFGKSGQCVEFYSGTRRRCARQKRDDSLYCHQHYNMHKRRERLRLVEE
jgi:hypothetical protein